MTRTPRATAFAARLARREVRRRPWRTLLVALLVAGPVAGMTVAAVVVRTGNVSPEREWRFQAGQADAVVQGPFDAAALPPGTRTLAYRHDYLSLRTPDRLRVYGEVTELAPSEPLAEGIYVHVTGRSPSNSSEMLLSRHAARLLGVGIGDTVVLDRPWPVRAKVVGLADRAWYRDGDFVVVAPGLPFKPSALTHLVDLPDSLPAAEKSAWVRAAAAKHTGEAMKNAVGGVNLGPELSKLGVPGGVGAVVAEDDENIEQVAWTWVIGAAVLTVVGIVIASAFAAGGRRQLTTLGQLAANGAGTAVLRRVLVLQGTWTGLAGAALGLAGGAGLLAALAPYRYRLLSRDVGPYDVRPLDLVPIVLLAVVAATVAALVPARTLSRTPVLNALAGRRPLGAVPRWLAPTGVAVSAGGLALLGLAVLGSTGADVVRSGPGSARVWALTGGVGAVAVLLGACAVAPRYVSVLDPLAARLHGAWRFAARSLARQRTRTAAVVSAVCVTSALALAASAMVLGVTAQDANRMPYVARNHAHVTTASVVEVPGATAPTYRPEAVPAELLAEVAAALPRATRLSVPRLVADLSETAFVPDSDAGRPVPAEMNSAAIATEETVRLYGPDDTVRRELAAAGAVAFGHVTGRLTLADGTGVRVLDRTKYAIGELPRLLLAPKVAAATGWAPAPPAFVFVAPDRLTERERIAVFGAYQDWAEDRPPKDIAIAQMVSIAVHFPTSAPSPRAVQGLLAAAALLFTVFFVAVSLALAAAETRDERDALTVVGAGTRVLRRTSGRKALIVTVLGSVLGVPVGLLPVAVLTLVDATALPFVMPWVVVALLVGVLPVVAGAVTTVASAVALRVRPVRVSTMAFD